MRGVTSLVLLFGIAVFAAAMNDTIDHWLTLAVIVLGGGALAFVVLREAAKELWFKFEMMAMDRHEANRRIEWARNTLHQPDPATLPVRLVKEREDG